jgi:hypothetical protein
MHAPFIDIAAAQTSRQREDGTAWALQDGNSPRTLVYVVPDAVYAGMWRIAWPDGRLSDMVNLSRAKDAAMAWGQRNAPGKDRNRLGWEKHPRKTPAEAPPVRFSRPVGTPMRPYRFGPSIARVQT